jgi:hypothetical protein
MLIPYEIVGDGLPGPMPIYNYDLYRVFWERRHIMYSKKKGWPVPEEYKYKDIGIIR